MERRLGESIAEGTETVGGYFETLKTKSEGLNKRVGGLEDLFQLVTNSLLDMKLEINNGIGELCRSVNQLKLTVEPKETREPDLTTLKTLKFSIGVASDVQSMISQGTQYDEHDFLQDPRKNKTNTASADTPIPVGVPDTDKSRSFAGDAHLAATSKGSLKEKKKTVVNREKDIDILQTTQNEEQDIPAADQKGHAEGSNVDPEGGHMSEADDVKPDLDSLESSMAKGSDYVETSQESVAFAAEVLAELGDIVNIREHQQATPTESDWPSKHAYKTFVTEEEGENDESLSEDSNIILDTQERGQTAAKSKSPLPGGFIISESVEDQDESVRDTTEGVKKKKQDDDKEAKEPTAAKLTSANVGIETDTSMGGLSGVSKGTKMNPKKVLFFLF